VLSALCEAHGLPVPQREFCFAPPRRWRFDFCWPDKLVALEQEGGAWTGGRHTRGLGFLRDIEKYNRAVLEGWSLFRCTPEQVRTGEILPLLKQVLQ
jgi:hypothetical protein